MIARKDKEQFVTVPGKEQTEAEAGPAFIQTGPQLLDSPAAMQMGLAESDCGRSPGALERGDLLAGKLRDGADKPLVVSDPHLQRSRQSAGMGLILPALRSRAVSRAMRAAARSISAGVRPYSLAA